MVAAVHYFATLRDHEELLDHLGEPVEVDLHPWPLVRRPPVVLTRDEALNMAQVMIACGDLGRPMAIRPGDAAMAESTKAGVFNRLNWERLRPEAREALVDSNASPVLFWTPGTATDFEIRVSSIGSQADSMRSISADYERWVYRVMGWVRRRGVKVWGLERSAIRPDLDIQLSFVNTVYALPDALSKLEHAAKGR